AKGDHEQFGIGYKVLDWAELKAVEPDLVGGLAGAIHWTAPWTVSDPGALVSAYFGLFEKLGGKFVRGAARGLSPEGGQWTTEVEGTKLSAKQTVIALGPWAPDVLEPLGY